MSLIRVPENLPKLKSDRLFDADSDLLLSEPEKVWTLKDFGYSERQQKNAPFPIAVTTPFRLLSDKGVEALREIITELTQYKEALHV